MEEVRNTNTDVRKAIQEAIDKGILEIETHGQTKRIHWDDDFYCIKCNKILQKNGLSKHLFYVHNIGKKQEMKLTYDFGHSYHYMEEVENRIKGIKS